MVSPVIHRCSHNLQLKNQQNKKCDVTKRLLGHCEHVAMKSLINTYGSR